MPKFIPKGLETVDAEQWCPENLSHTFTFLRWFLEREGTGQMEAYEGQVVFNVFGNPGPPAYLEDGDWLVFDPRQPGGKRFKVVDKCSFDSAYEEVS